MYTMVDYKTALGYVLRGRALRTFHSVKTWPQPDVIQILSDHYLEPESSLEEKVQEMETFSRQEGETIRTCMSRYKILVMDTEHDVRVDARTGRALVMMQDALKMRCSRTAREAIRQKEMMSRSEAFNPPFSDYLQIAERQETRERGFPIRCVPLKTEVPKRKTAAKSSTQERTVRTSSLSDWWAWLKRAWRRRPHLILRRQAEQDRVWARMVDNVRQETRARAMPKAGESR